MCSLMPGYATTATTNRYVCMSRVDTNAPPYKSKRTRSKGLTKEATVVTASLIIEFSSVGVSLLLVDRLTCCPPKYHRGSVNHTCHAGV